MRVKLLDLNEQFPKHFLSTSAARCSKIGSSSKALQNLKDQNKKKYSIELTKKISQGYGHENILEHVTFTFSIEKISRLAVEYLEHHRLASYTEKSFRLNQEDINFYSGCNLNFTPLKEGYFQLKNLGISAELARNILPLAVLTDLQFTTNARELLYIISHLKNSDLQETQELGDKLYRNFIQVFNEDYQIDKGDVTWNPYTEIPSLNNDVIVSVKNCLSNSERTELKKGSDRINEAIKIKIKGHLTSSALAQLRRHRMGTLFTTIPYAHLQEFLPSTGDKKLNRKIRILVNNIKREISKLNDWELNRYGALMGGVRRYLWITDYRNIQKYLKLRTHKSAQAEIRSQSIEIQNQLKRKVDGILT